MIKIKSIQTILILILSLLSHALLCQSPLEDFNVEDMNGKLKAIE